MSSGGEHFNRGRLFSMKGLYVEAIDAYKKALEVDPGHTQARTNLHFICCFSGIGIGEDRIGNVAKTRQLRKNTCGRPSNKSPSLSILQKRKLL